MVLVYHMLHLNAVRQLWSSSVPGCGPAPRRSLPLVGKCFQWEQEEATFHGATSRCRTQRMRWVHLCVSMCIFPWVYHYCTTFIEETKRWSGDQDWRPFSCHSKSWLYHFFWLRKVVGKVVSCNESCRLLFVTFLIKNGAFFIPDAKLKKNILYFCSATLQVKGGFAAALFLTLTLLLTPIETVCQSNHAPSQTSPRVENCCISSTMLHSSLHIPYLPQRGRGFNKETIR